ncbi:hypothetical protein [Sinomonas sp. G460-2]|uniref:hypothetical protein n=1 Tax=Sinomonas sp. G460-2 TaxID=3393464 RepID=UPI0039EEFD78
MDAEAEFKAAIGAPADADLTTKSVWTWPIETKDASRAHVRESRTRVVRESAIARVTGS